MVGYGGFEPYSYALCCIHGVEQFRGLTGHLNAWTIAIVEARILGRCGPAVP